MTLRPLAAADLEAIRRLRNQHRESFFDTAEISAEQQARWFANQQGRAARFYVIEEDGNVIGTISVTDTDRGREIGNLVLDDRYRGRGLMTQAVRELTEPPGDYFAEVKPGNHQSLAVFERAGFTQSAIRVDKRSAD